MNDLFDLNGKTAVITGGGGVLCECDPLGGEAGSAAAQAVAAHLEGLGHFRAPRAS